MFEPSVRLVEGMSSPEVELYVIVDVTAAGVNFLSSVLSVPFVIHTFDVPLIESRTLAFK